MANKKKTIPAHYSWNSSIFTRGVVDPIKRKLGYVDENEHPVSLKESATGQELDRMNDTAKKAATIAMTGLGVSSVPALARYTVSLPQIAIPEIAAGLGTGIAGAKVGEKVDKALGGDGYWGSLIGGLGVGAAGVKGLDALRSAPKIVGKGNALGYRFLKDIFNTKNLNSPLRYTKTTYLPSNENTTVKDTRLYDILTGKEIGQLGTVTKENGPSIVTHIFGSNGNKNISRDLYSAEILKNSNGVRSGDRLIHGEITRHVWDRYFPTRKVISNTGFHQINGESFYEQPVVVLDRPSTFIQDLSPHIIEYTNPRINSFGKTSYKLYERPSTLSEAERLGIPRGERIYHDPEVINNAKAFAEKYGYETPETLNDIKNMYRRHNTVFRTVSTDLEPEILGDKIASLPKEEQSKFLASRGYPQFMRDYLPESMGKYTDEYVFVSPSGQENLSYFGDGTQMVKLQRPFSWGKPKEWHLNADWRPSAESPNSYPSSIGQTITGNTSPDVEFQISTKKLIPKEVVSKREGNWGDGTLLGNYLTDKWANLPNWERGNWPHRFDFTQIKKQGGILKRVQKGQNGLKFEEWYKTVPKEKNDTTTYNLRRTYELAPRKQLDNFVKKRKAHLYSAYENPETGIWEFMKRKDHPTIQLELDWYNSDDPEAVEFRKKYKLDTSGDYYKYVPR